MEQFCENGDNKDLDGDETSLEQAFTPRKDNVVGSTKEDTTDPEEDGLDIIDVHLKCNRGKSHIICFGRASIFYDKYHD